MDASKLLERATIGADVLEAYDAAERALRSTRDPEIESHLQVAVDALLRARYVLDAPR